MSFDLTIVFTGLVGFVENRCINSRARMCALLVDGDPGRCSALDSTLLRQHRAFVRFPIDNVSVLSRQLATRSMDESFGLWYLNREMVFVELAETTDAIPGINDFHIDRMEVPRTGHPRRPADVPPRDRSSFTWILDLERVFPRFRVDPRVLTATPPRESVAAQFVIDRGTVQTKSITRAVWRYDDTLSGAPYEQAFSHEIMVSLRNLSAARLVAVGFDPPRRRKFLDLTGLQRGGQLEIKVINICDCNPLQWPRQENPVPDKDTKWIFEIMAEDLHEEVRKILKGRPLPIPHPHEIIDDGLGAPGTGNCIDTRLPSTPFTFEELDGAGFVCRE